MQHNGRRRDYGLGSALDVTLTEARDAAAALRRQIRAGIDPVAERRKSRKVVPSFETAARECYEALKDGWKNQNYRNWISSMENRSEEHTSELQSLMRLSYAVFCLKHKTTRPQPTHSAQH